MKSRSRWISRPTSDGKNIYYDRHTGKLVQKPADCDDVSEGDVETSKGFHPSAPLKAYLDITYRCNFRCIHCITSSHPRYDISRELETERLLELVGELASLGVLEVGIGGGEPFVHRDWFDIFSSVTRSGMNLIVTSNGSLITRENLSLLREVQPFDMRVSFDGGKQLHEHVRGKGSYQKAILALTSLVAEGIPSTARLTLSSGGDEGIPGLFQDLEGTGVKRVKVALTKSAGRAKVQGSHLVRAIATEETAGWLMSLGRDRGLLVELSSEDFEANLLAIVDSRLRETAPNCGAGFETVHISATGTVSACVTMPTQIFGELHTNSFTEIWLGASAARYRIWASSCRQQRICDVCPSKCK